MKRKHTALGAMRKLFALSFIVALGDSAAYANNARHIEQPNHGGRPHHLRNGTHRSAMAQFMSQTNSIALPGQVSAFQTATPAHNFNRSGKSFYINDAGNARALRNGLSLDLASIADNITVGSNLIGDRTIVIDVGGQTKEINAGSKVTAAEYAALSQMLATGVQGLVLDNRGAATGGALNINTVSDDGRTIRTSGLVIPENVTVAGDFGRMADGVRVSRDLVNYGSLYAVSSNSAKQTAVIVARDINNEQGGLISTNAPDSVSSQLGASSSILNLVLRADRDLNNEGSISSSGNLELSAGRSLNNASARHSAGTATVQANGSLLINSSQVNNAGSINSLSGDVRISGATDSDITVNNTGGEIRALAGNIDVTTNSSVNPKLNTTLIGGAWNANELNINSSDGEASGRVDESSAVVNINAGTAHFGSNSDLKLGAITLTGDPVFEAAGNLTIAGSILTNGNPLAIIAGGNVTVAAAAPIINTSSATGGGSILIVAGADHTPSGSNIQINGPLGGGGSIDLTNLTTLTSKTSGTGNGGDVTMAAFFGAINIPTGVTIQTGGSGAGVNGNVQIIADDTTSFGMKLGSINTVGGTGGGGNVQTANSSIQIIGSFLVDNTNPATTGGGIVSGSFSPLGVALKGTTIGTITAAGVVDIISGGSTALVGVSGTDISINSEQGITASKINGTGNVFITAPSLGISNGGTVSGDTLTIQSQPGTGLILNGGAATAATFNASGVGQSVKVTAQNNNLNLFNKLTFIGNADLFADNGTAVIIVDPAATIVGQQRLTLHTSNLDLQGTLTGNPVEFTSSLGFATIANSTGPLDLNGLILRFIDTDLALLSAGDIVNTGKSATLDLSSALGAGRSLLMIAGYKFTPTTIGTDGPNNLLYTLDPEPNSGSGSINLSNVNINTFGSTISGGVQAFAHGGSVNLGSIDVSSPGIGGSVQVFATTSIDVGAIDTTGTTLVGSVGLVVGQLVPQGPVQVQGTLLGAFGVPNQIGSITTKSINTGTGTISIGGGGAGNAITVNGALTGRQILLGIPLGNLNLPTTNVLTAQTDVFGNGGQVSIFASSITTSGGPLAMNAIGSTGNGGKLFFQNSSNSTVTVGGAGATITMDAHGATGGGDLNVSGDGDVTINAGGLNATGPNGKGARFNIQAGLDGSGTLLFNDSTFFAQANATGASFNGGNILLSAPVISYPSSAASPFQLSANGSGSGAGGGIFIEDGSTTQTFIGPAPTTPKGPANFLSLSAKGGLLGGNGGSIDVSSGGNLTVNPAGVDAAPQAGNSKGAIYSFHAGTGAKGGNLLITGDLDASGLGTGNGGRITLDTSNKKDLVLGSIKAKNGSTGTLKALGANGSISATNFAGGISISNSSALSAPFLTLLANEKGSITSAKGVLITSSSRIIMTAEEGSIGGTGSKTLQVSTPVIQFDTQGLVGLNDSFLGAFTLNDSTAGKGLVLTTAGATELHSIATTKGSITVTSATGLLQVFAKEHLNAANGALTLQNSDTTSGSITINDDAIVETTGKGKVVTIAIGPAPKKGTSPFPPAPANINVNPTGKGNAFFGPAGGVVGPASALTPATVNATNINVIFNNGSSNVVANPIKLGNNAVITADPPAPHSIYMRVASDTDLHTGAESNSAFGSLIETAVAATGVLSLNNENALSMSISAITPVALFGLGRIDQDQLTVNSNLMQVGNVDLQQTNDASFSNLVTVSTNDRDSNSTLPFRGNRRVDGVMIDGKIEQSTASHQVLNNGNVVFVPSADTVVETMHGSVNIGKGSVALVMASENGLAVYDLDDHRSSAVSVRASGKQINLSPGRHVLVTRSHSRSFNDVNVIELVQYRGINKSKLNNGSEMHTAEFSIPSACFAVKPLKSLMAAKYREARKIADHMLKTTAVVMTMNPDRGDFIQYFRPRTTAMSR